jgi:hypothetical protein
MPELAVIAAFDQLPGQWDLNRTISGGGTVLGQAEFSSRTPGVLHYLETGELSLSSGYVGKVYREYYYGLEEDHIHVSFADSAPGEHTFLRLYPVTDGHGGHLQAKDTHYCGDDVYEATYSFESAGRIVMTVGVYGQKKDYTIHTMLTKSPQRH